MAKEAGQQRTAANVGFEEKLWASAEYKRVVLGELFEELDLTQGGSTGILAILRAMKNNGSPPPEFDSDEDRTYFLVRLPVHERAHGREPESGALPFRVLRRPRSGERGKTVISAELGQDARWFFLDANAPQRAIGALGRSYESLSRGWMAGLPRGRRSVIGWS